MTISSFILSWMLSSHKSNSWLHFTALIPSLYSACILSQCLEPNQMIWPNLKWLHSTNFLLQWEVQALYKKVLLSNHNILRVSIYLLPTLSYPGDSVNVLEVDSSNVVCILKHVNNVSQFIIICFFYSMLRKTVIVAVNLGLFRHINFSKHKWSFMGME